MSTPITFIGEYPPSSGFPLFCYIGPNQIINLCLPHRLPVTQFACRHPLFAMKWIWSWHLHRIQNAQFISWKGYYVICWKFLKFVAVHATHSHYLWFMLILFTGLGQHYQHPFLYYEMSRLNKNPTLLKTQFSNWNAWTPLNEFLRAPKCFVDKQITI